VGLEQDVREELNDGQYQRIADSTRSRFLDSEIRVFRCWPVHFLPQCAEGVPLMATPAE